MAPKSSDKKTMDVSKPGESAPDVSARPVLVTHRPMVQDPTIREPKTPDAPNEPQPKNVPHSEKVIQPVTSEAKVDTPKEPDTETPKKSETPDQEPEKVEKSAETKAAEDAAVVEAVADQATEEKKKQNQLSDEEKAKQAAIQKLVDEKRYFVSIGQVTRRRNRRVVIALVALAIFLVAAYFAMDAGLI